MYYTLTIGISAFLLFLVQPLISKMLLPWFGGGASIWITSLVFFQTMLLLGYGATHYLVRWLGLRRHLILTMLVLACSLLFLPISASIHAASTLPPSLQLFWLLTLSVGLPYLALATTSPTLQYWIANDTRTQAQSPYVQYGVSNLGSLSGLLAFPFVLEIFYTSETQSWIWTTLYIGYALLLGATVILFLKHNPGTTQIAARPDIDLTHNLRIRWIFKAMVPSALLLVTTHFLTQDVVNLPLLWVAPLCLYLLTFIICFLFPQVSRPRNIRTLLGIVSILVLLVTNHGLYEFGFDAKLGAALTCLFMVCMIFHGDLERTKPDKQDLTDFYLQVAAGGALGSITAGIVAPLIFDSTFEFYVVLVIALYYLVLTQFPMQGSMQWLFRGTVTFALLISFLTHETGFGNETIFQARSFYSTYAVREERGEQTVRRLVAGTHVHGMQYADGPNEHVPIAYYHEESGIGHLFKALDPARTGAIGLGIGSIVEFGGASNSFEIFELDPLVVDIAKNEFTVLRDTDATVDIYIGDGRIQLRGRPDSSYDLFVLDAFTSGSIPTHLLTLEAMQEILRKMKPGGMVSYHISNHYIDLLPVLNAIAHELGLKILYHEAPGDDHRFHYTAIWVVLTGNDALVTRLQSQYPGWREPPAGKILWRDGFSNIWSVIK